MGFIGVLIPMWWGGFSELNAVINGALQGSLNPHVVGRFFRVTGLEGTLYAQEVLIPMWWGGFSERMAFERYFIASGVLIPMWWGGFSE